MTDHIRSTSQRKPITVSLSQYEVDCLVCDCLMAMIGPPESKNSYQFVLLNVVASQQPAMFEAGIVECRHVFSDNSINKILVEELGRPPFPNDDAPADEGKILEDCETMVQGERRHWKVSGDPNISFALAEKLESMGYGTILSGNTLVAIKD